MLSFVVPLMAFGGVEAVVAILLLLPLPFSRPAILLCKLTRTEVGRTVVMTTAAVLFALLAAPAWDLVHMADHPQPAVGASLERREQEATSNLSAVLTGSTLMTMFVLRKLGLALADLDELTSKTGYEGKTQATNMFTGKGTSVSEEGIEKAE
eukprot:jgi/Astpho2/6412/Aster-08098